MTKRTKTNRNRYLYLSLGVLLTIEGIYLNYEAILNGDFPDTIMLLALGVNQLLLAYLYPHLFPKDERSKEIFGKSMTINYFVLFASITVLILATGSGSFGFVTLDATQALIVLFCIMVIAIPGTMVFYSKIL